MKLVYKLLIVLGLASVAVSLICLVILEVSYFLYAVTSGLTLLALGSIGLDVSEVLGYLRSPKETRLEEKQRLWKEHQESIRPPRDS